MKHNTITNIYVNEYQSSIKFCMNMSNIQEELKVDSEMHEDSKTFDELSGIVDGNIMNAKYSKLITKASLQNVNAEEVVELINCSMSNFKHSSQYFQLNMQIPTADEQENIEDEVESQMKVWIIYETNFLNFHVKEVAQKYDLSVKSVIKNLKEFKSKLKKPDAFKCRLGRPSKLSKERKKWLEDKIKTSYLGKHFTLCTLKRIILQRFPDLLNISTATLSRILKHDFWLSYKKVTAWVKVLTPEMKSWFLKWASSISFLLDNIKCLTFIDEFKISPVKKDNYAWSVKGKPAWKFGYNSTFEISAIVAFNAEGRVYFLGTKQTINSEIFQFFLTKLISNEDRRLDNDERVWILKLIAYILRYLPHFKSICNQFYQIMLQFIKHLKSKIYWN